MDGLTIILDSHAYKIKFGYGVFKRYALLNGLEDFTQVGEKITALNFGKTKSVTFQQIDFLTEVVKCSIESAEGKEIPFTADDIADKLLKDNDLLESIMIAFSSSLPQEESDSEGKQPRTKKK